MKSKKDKRIDILTKRAKIAATWAGRIKLTGLSEKDFADKHGFIASNITRWTSGETIPGAGHVDLMEKALATYS